MSLQIPAVASHAAQQHLAVPSKGRGHRHRRSAAVSLDWRHVALPPIEQPMSLPTARPASCSPTLTFASTLSDTSLEDAESVPVASTQPSAQRGDSIHKRVSFADEVSEIPPRESGDTWMKPEDYSWSIPTSDSKTVLLDPLEPSIDLSPAIPTHVPGSPVLMHRKKRSSFLQTTKNALTRRPSKKRPTCPVQNGFDIPVPAPKSSMIDLDLALAPNVSLRHKKSGSLGAFSGLPASPSKPKSSFHRRADSAPADILFSFTPRPASPESRKRKMSSILEHPNLSTAQLTGSVDANTSNDTSSSLARSTGLTQEIADAMIFGQPGEMISTTNQTDSVTPAIAALRGHHDSAVLACKGTKKGWKGMLHRLLH